MSGTDTLSYRSASVFRFPGIFRVGYSRGAPTGLVYVTLRARLANQK